MTDTPAPLSADSLRDEIAMIVVYTDNTPNSNEPTELETLLKQYDAQHVLDEIEALLAAQKQRWEVAARIDEWKRYRQFKNHLQDDGTSGYLINNYEKDRIAALDGVTGEQQA